MKNGIRIFLVCFVLIGGTAVFGYWSLNRFNKSLDTFRDTCFAIANAPPVLYCNKTNKEQISTTITAATIPEELVPAPAPEPVPAPEPAPVPAPAPEPTQEITPASAIPTDLNLSFVFPKKTSEVYNGCTYQISFQSSAAIGSLATALIDAGAKEPVDPIKSGLAKENEIAPNSQSFDWKVGAVWPGEYYIKVTDIKGVDVRSGVFTIKNRPSGGCPL